MIMITAYSEYQLDDYNNVTAYMEIKIYTAQLIFLQIINKVAIFEDA